jgi:predicted Zn-dependent protease
VRQGEPAAAEARVLDEPRAAKADELSTRRRLGIPSGGTAFVLRREDEQAYADAFNGVGALIVDNKLKDAQKNLDTALKKFPGAPGLLTASCELAWREGRLRQATKRCTDSLAVMDDQPRAHYLLGCVQAELGQPDRAIASLKRAIDLDGRERSYWESLAALYRGLGRRREFTQFTIEYESRAPKP